MLKYCLLAAFIGFVVVWYQRGRILILPWKEKEFSLSKEAHLYTKHAKLIYYKNGEEKRLLYNAQGNSEREVLEKVITGWTAFFHEQAPLKKKCLLKSVSLGTKAAFLSFHLSPFEGCFTAHEEWDVLLGLYKTIVEFLPHIVEVSVYQENKLAQTNFIYPQISLDMLLQKNARIISSRAQRIAFVPFLNGSDKGNILYDTFERVRVKALLSSMVLESDNEKIFFDFSGTLGSEEWYKFINGLNVDLVILFRMYPSEVLRLGIFVQRNPFYFSVLPSKDIAPSLLYAYEMSSEHSLGFAKRFCDHLEKTEKSVLFNLQQACFKGLDGILKPCFFCEIGFPRDVESERIKRIFSEVG